MTSPKGKGKADGHESLRNRLSGPSDNKAGLTRDPEEVKNIIYEASKGSAYFLNEARKDEELTRKVNQLVAEIDALVEARGGDLRQEELCVDEMIRDLEKKERDLSQVVVVIDADAFYASCHELIEPRLKGTAFAVGQGVLTTASYKAREYGCRSAQAGYIAIKLCPHLEFVKPDFSLYTKLSKKIMAILSQYGTISPASLDEACASMLCRLIRAGEIDVARSDCSLTDYCDKQGVTPEVAAQRMRDRVKRETGLTVSAGISANAMLSKVAADLRKPDGQYFIPRTREDIMNFTKDLPIRRIPGIGRVSERWLSGLGVHTVADIYRMRGKLFLIRKKVSLTFLLRAYLGLGRTTIAQASRGSRKAVGCEETFHPIDKVELLYDQLRKIAETLEGDLRRTEYSGRTITLKLKHDTYEVITRAYTAGKTVFISDAKSLYTFVQPADSNLSNAYGRVSIGKKLLDKEIADFAQTQVKKKGLKPVTSRGMPKQPLRLRLMGLRVSNLRDERDGNLNKWANTSNKGEQLVTDEDTEQHNTEMIQLSSDEETEEAVISGPASPNDERGPSQAGSSPSLIGETHKLSERDGKGTLAPFSSSDALWAAVGDFPIDENFGFTADEVDGDELSDDRHKPFWTAGESKNSKKSLAYDPVTATNRLAFHTADGSSTSAGSSTASSRSQMLTCPVCEKQFVATEASMAHHVEMHFAKSQTTAKKVKPSSDQSGRTQSKRKDSAVPSGQASGKRAKLESYWARP